VTWRIIKQGWEGSTHLCDSRIDEMYAYEELNGARFITSDSDSDICNDDICFELPDKRIIWLMNADLETVRPWHDPYLREPYDDDDRWYRYSVWWCAAGCLPDYDNPAFSADTLEEIDAWLRSDEADEYRSAEGEFSTYSFEIHDTDMTRKETN